MPLVGCERVKCCPLRCSEAEVRKLRALPHAEREILHLARQDRGVSHSAGLCTIADAIVCA